MVLVGILLVLIGLVICFRGVFIGKVFKAVFGAIQGAIYALTLQIILTLLRIATSNLLFVLIVVCALLMAYIAAMQEELYKKIQGIINATMIGGVIGAIVYAAIWAHSFVYDWDGGSSANGVAIIAGIAVVILFVAMGAKWYKGFRRVGSFVLTVVIAAVVFIMYMPIAPAFVFALIVAGLFIYILNVCEKYVDFLKVSAIGAIITVAGVFAIIGQAELIAEIPEMLFANVSRAIAGRSGYNYYGAETVCACLGIAALSFIGMFSQYNYVAAHTDGSGRVVIDWSASKKAVEGAGQAANQIATGVASGFHSFFRRIADFFKRSKTQIIKAVKVVLIACIICGLIAGLIYGGVSLYGWIMHRKDIGRVDSAASRLAKNINNAYGKELISVSDASFVGGEGDGFDSSFNADISGELNGSIIATGISDPNSDAWYPEYVRVEIATDDNAVNDTARLFAAVISQLFNANQTNCEAIILDTLLYGDFYSSIYTPWVEVDLGRSANASVQISLTDDGRTWSMTCGPKF